MIRLGNPGFAFGFLAAALPILVHLLLRDRIRRVAFSTLRFLRRAPRHVLRQKVVSEVVLVLLQVTACVLAALFAGRLAPRADPAAMQAAPGGGHRGGSICVGAPGGRPVRLRRVTAVLDSLRRRDAAAWWRSTVSRASWCR